MNKSSNYRQLEARAARGETLLLDGAVGTELQRLGAPMDGFAWAAVALETHPDTVLRMHRAYVGYGADIITTNTFSSARHNLESAGLGEATEALNRRAVELARTACAAAGRPIAIAGAISHFGVLVGGEGDLARTRHEPAGRPEIDEATARASLREQADLLADAGVDLLLLESTGNMRQREWLLQETAHLDLPRWLGFRCRLDPGDPQPRVGYGSDTLFEHGLAILERYPVEGVAIFHSLADATTAALPLLRERWNGLIAVYPEAQRGDYTARERNPDETASLIPAELPTLFARWRDLGAQVVGGCCGIDAEYYAGLATTLKRSHS